MSGARTGKLLADPVVWFSVNATLDGIDPGSDNPVERMKYAVYQRRMLLSALKDKAMLMALCGEKEGAAKVAEAYIEAAIPMTKHAETVRKIRQEQLLEEIATMGPQRARAVGPERMPGA